MRPIILIMFQDACQTWTYPPPPKNGSHPPGIGMGVLNPLATPKKAPTHPHPRLPVPSSAPRQSQRKCPKMFPGDFQRGL